jgi:hypothetical protein
MTIHGTDLEKALKHMLQKNIYIEIKDKNYKSGKLILFYQRNFYITLVMNTKKKEKEKVEIPIPFNVELHEDENLIYFDYRIKTLCKYAPEIETNLMVYPKKIAGNKFWDSILMIDTNYENNI